MGMIDGEWMGCTSFYNLSMQLLGTGGFCHFELVNSDDILELHELLFVKI